MKSPAESFTKTTALICEFALYLLTAAIILGKIALDYWPLYAVVYLRTCPEWLLSLSPLRERAYGIGTTYSDRLVPSVLFMMFVVTVAGLFFAVVTDVLIWLTRKTQGTVADAPTEKPPKTRSPLFNFVQKHLAKYLSFRLFSTQIPCWSLASVFGIVGGFEDDVIASVCSVALLMLILVPARYGDKLIRSPDPPLKST